MRKLFRWQAFAALLAVGSMVPSCATDLRDSAWGAVLDAFGGGITDGLSTGVPLADLIALALAT